MPRNVEIKAVISDFDGFLQKVVDLVGCAGSAVHSFKQEDTFYEVPNGRLKLRLQDGKDPQLVYYQRADSDGPKMSEYECCDLPVGTNIASVLSQAIGIKGVVKKTRTLCMFGQTRIHIDRVEDLGDFMELEVVLNEEQSASEGEKIAKVLMEKLDISEESLIKGAYMDHILSKHRT